MKKETEEEKEAFWTFNRVLFLVAGIFAVVGVVVLHDLDESYNKRRQNRKDCKVECLGSGADKEGKKTCMEECEIRHSFY